MKTLTSSLAILATLVGSASASVIVSEDFSYSDGSLTTNAAWNTISGTTGDLLVSSGQAIVQHGIPSEDANTVFTAQTSGTVYFSLDFLVQDLGAPYSGSDAEYFTHFTAGASHVARLYVATPSGSGDFTVGIANSSSSAVASWATDLSFDTVYLAVVAYDIDNNATSLWIDPSSEGDTSIDSVSGTASLTISKVGLRQSDSSQNETITVDNLVVATIFDEVIGVPEPTSLLLGALGLLGLLRRRR